MALGELLEIMFSNGSSYFLTGQVILKPMKSILHITKNNSIRNVIRSQCLKYIGHVCRCPNTTLTNKMMLFAKSRRPYKRDPRINIAKPVINVSIEQAKRSTIHKIRVVSLHWSGPCSDLSSPVQLHGNRFIVWRILTVL